MIQHRHFQLFICSSFLYFLYPCCILIYSLAPKCFLFICSPYQSCPSLLVLFPSGYLSSLLMFFYLTELILCSHLQSSPVWVIHLPSWFIITSILSNYYSEVIYNPCQSRSSIVILVAFGFHCRLALLCLRVLLNRNLVDSLELQKVFRSTKSDTACLDTNSLSCKNFASLKSVLL